MPGPVSDSFDPEFGTGENADKIKKAILDVSKIVSRELGERQPIVNVVNGFNGPFTPVGLTNKERRIIRFALERAAETL